MQQEITAIEASLAETEGRLEINEDDICHALQLAADIESIYGLADERTNTATTKPSSSASRSKARWYDRAAQTRS
jgi:hypothetical protein